MQRYGKKRFREVPKARYHFRISASLAEKISLLARKISKSFSSTVEILLGYALDKLEADGFEREEQKTPGGMTKRHARGEGLQVRRRPDAVIREDLEQEDGF